MGEFEAIGDVVSGGMLGRAVEPRAGEVGADGHTHETECLNCGTALQGEFCHACGQHGHVHRTLSAFFHDILHGVLHFEGKTWRTLPLLAWRPGELTRRYIDGERAKFVSPMGLFLFSVFLMFAVIGFTNIVHFAEAPEVRSQIQADVAKDEAKLKALQADRAAAKAAGKSTAAIDDRMAKVEEDLKVEREMVKRGVVQGTVNKVSTDIPGPIGEAIRKANANPDLFLYKLKSSAYKWSWALIPLSIPFMWLLFPFSRRFRLYDHTVFVTYSLCFMTLLACVAAIFGAVGLGPVAGLMVLVPPVHIYRQLKGAYGLGRFGALWRTAVLVVVGFAVLVGFIILLAALGLFE